MQWRNGILVAAVVFLVLFIFFTPRQYSRVDEKGTFHWTETLISPIWKHCDNKYFVFQIPNQGVIIGQEALSEFQSQSLARGIQPRRLPIRVPITERNYVLLGYSASMLLGYLLVSASVGALVALAGVPIRLLLNWLAVLGGSFLKPRRSETPSPPPV